MGNPLVLGLLAVAVPIGRCVAGWLKESLKDGQITSFEWKQLAVSVLSIGTTALIAYLGYETYAVENAEVLAVVSAFLVEKALDALKQE